MTLVIGFWLGVGVGVVVGIAAMHWLDMTYAPPLEEATEPPRDYKPLRHWSRNGP